MKNARFPIVLILALFVLGSIALAGDAAKEGKDAKGVTLEGKVACAKCTLKAADADKCQTVLVVSEKEGKESHYYIVKNDVAEGYGHVCQGTKDAVVTGTVEEKDGKTWLTATKMEEPKKS